MKIENALQEFGKVLASQGKEVEALTPSSGIAAFVSFYRDERVEGCSLEADEDMLLYQWGTHDWGEGEWFELNITRQLTYSDGEDNEIWQLSLTFKFHPTNALQGFDDGNKWCFDLQQVAEFETYINQSAAYQTFSQNRPDAVELNYSCAG